MTGELARIARGEGVAPLAWAGGTSAQDYLNLGDALSPVMVALLSGRPVRRVPFQSQTPRLAAVGTIGQNFAGGEVWFWGTGCSPFATAAGQRARFTPDPGMRAHVRAARGPLSASLLGGGRLAARVFGDPVWLLPRFYRPEVEKRWELGVIVHLSELADRATECHPRPELRRLRVPKALRDSVRLINTVVPISTAGMQARLDEILACRRIVSTSLHGLVFAESYGIPCLPFPAAGPAPGKAGVFEVALTAEAAIDSRMVDLYMGVGRTRQPAWGQPRDAVPDWEAVIRAIDARWEPAAIDEDALIETFPLDVAPLAAPPGETIWRHPVLNAVDYAHDVAALRRADAEAARTAAAAETEARALWRRRLSGWRLPAVVAAPPSPAPITLRREEHGATIALSWAAGPADAATVNIGDALSPVVVAALSGVPVRHAAFDSDRERLVAVGTIAHGQTRGVAHLWGCGLDETVNPLAPGEPWRLPPDVEFRVHATRGPFTAAALRRAGVAAPEVFGDPVSMIDRIFPLGAVEKTHDLGVILHLSELDRSGPDGPRPRLRPRPEMLRYAIPDAFADRVRLIDTLTAPTRAAFAARLREIAACRAILSTSLHGLVIAEAYGVPCAWFGFGDLGLRDLDPMNRSHSLDHRVRDLYAGRGVSRLRVIHARRDRPADWDRLIGLAGDLDCARPDVRALFDAYPGPRLARWDEPEWPLPPGLAGRIP